MPSSKPIQSEANCWFYFHWVLWLKVVELRLPPQYVSYRRGAFPENRIYLSVVDPLLHFSELSLCYLNFESSVLSQSNHVGYMVENEAL